MLKQQQNIQTFQGKEFCEYEAMKQDISALKTTVDELKEKLLLRTAELARNKSNLGRW